MHLSPNQQKIWAHFQNAAPESFAAAHPRLEFLLASILRKSSTAKPTVLNIGIGDGYFERQAQSRDWVIHSLDPDQQAVERLASGGVAAKVGMIECIPLPAKSLDFVVASEVLEHLTAAQRQAGLAEILRVLRGDGWFLGTVPYNENLAEQQTVCPSCGEVFHRWGHQESFDLLAIRRMLEPEFTIVELRRTAFVAFRGRSLVGKLKSMVRLILARFGQPIAVPTILWIARKS